MLEAFSTEYDSIIGVVNGTLEFLYLDELESLLLSQEYQIEKTKKEVVETVIVNLA